MNNLVNNWNELLLDEVNKDYYLKLKYFLKEEYESSLIYPELKDVFNALKYTSYAEVNVVILGQDPLPWS